MPPGDLMQNLAWYAKCVWVMSVWVNHQATAFAHQDRKRGIRWDQPRLPALRS